MLMSVDSVTASAFKNAAHATRGISRAVGAANLGGGIAGPDQVHPSSARM